MHDSFFSLHDSFFSLQYFPVLLLKHLAMQTQDWAVSLLHSTVMVLISVLVVQTNTADVYPYFTPHLLLD